MMKTKFLIAILLIGVLAQAGDKIGHGGGLFTCGILPNIQVGMLVDLYEAQEEYGLTPIASTQPITKIVNERLNFLNTNLPEYARILQPYLDDVNLVTQIVNATLTPVNDSLYHIKPTAQTCGGAEWNYTQFANFTDEHRLLIQKDLWGNPNIPTLDKSALIWHEAIYLWLRQEKSDTSSIRARQITGILYSTLDASHMRAAIEKVLGAAPAPTQSWICLSQNVKANTYFKGTGQLEREARMSAIKTCQASAGNDTFFCGEDGVTCDQLEDDPPKYFCDIKNPYTGVIFTSRGRSKIEASYNVLLECASATTSAPACHRFDLKCQ